MTDPAKFASEWRANIKASGVLAVDSAKCHEAIDHIEQLNQRLHAEYNRGAKDADGNRLSQAAYQAALDAAYNAGVEDAAAVAIDRAKWGGEWALCAADVTESIRSLRKGT